MAFVVEDGTGKTDANSYASVAAADSYAADRGITSWAALTTTAKQQALIKATDYLEATYQSAWKGYRNTLQQALAWPRYEVIVDGFLLPNNAIPSAVVKACVDMAFKASAGTTLIEDTGRVITREKVDVIETEYSEYGPVSTQYVEVSRSLSPYLSSASSGGAFAQVGIVRT